jgi:hypothetical protein
MKCFGRRVRSQQQQHPFPIIRRQTAGIKFDYQNFIIQYFCRDPPTEDIKLKYPSSIFVEFSKLNSDSTVEGNNGPSGASVFNNLIYCDDNYSTV